MPGPKPGALDRFANPQQVYKRESNPSVPSQSGAYAGWQCIANCHLPYHASHTEIHFSMSSLTVGFEPTSPANFGTPETTRTFMYSD